MPLPLLAYVSSKSKIATNTTSIVATDAQLCICNVPTSLSRTHLYLLFVSLLKTPVATQSYAILQNIDSLYAPARKVFVKMSQCRSAKQVVAMANMITKPLIPVYTNSCSPTPKLSDFQISHPKVLTLKLKPAEIV